MCYNYIDNIPGNSQLLMGNKESSPAQRRHKESTDMASFDQNPLIKVSTKPRNNQQDVSEEVVKTLPDSPVHQ